MSENNSLFGPQFIQQLRSSGYKNPIYAMAEIIDNSVDAKATEIDITIVEQNYDTGVKKTRKIKKTHIKKLSSIKVAFRKILWV